MLVSDAMRGGGLGEGVWDLGGQQVTVRGGEARLADGTIAGSVLTLDRALRNFREGTGLSLEEMMPLTSGNAARVLGMDHRLGRVAPGYDADLVLLDDEGVVRRTVVGGETIYDAVDGS
ncbi:MAG TPA: amidohydrolase family protein [Synergistaceae bacterium]|nr:amidohydrolase family protein [Synergistaceae bacterium]